MGSQPSAMDIGEGMFVSPFYRNKMRVRTRISKSSPAQDQSLLELIFGVVTAINQDFLVVVDVYAVGNQ